MVELDVHWSDGADLDKVGAADISVRIDNTPLPHPKPLRSDAGMRYGFELGSFNAIMSALSRGKRFRISIPDKPERSADVDIGAGKKAVAFLRECDMYSTNFKTATHAWGKGRASAKVGEYAQAIIYFDQAIAELPTDEANHFIRWPPTRAGRLDPSLCPDSWVARLRTRPRNPHKFAVAASGARSLQGSPLCRYDRCSFGVNRKGAALPRCGDPMRLARKLPPVRSLSGLVVRLCGDVRIRRSQRREPERPVPMAPTETPATIVKQLRAETGVPISMNLARAPGAINE